MFFAYISLEVLGAFLKYYPLELLMMWQLFIMSAIAYRLCGYCNMKWMLLVVMLYNAYISLSETFAPYGDFIAVEVILLVLFTYYEYLRTIHIRSDAPREDTVCLLFRKPSTLWQFITTLFGSPASSFGMIVGKNKYQMKRHADTIQSEEWGDLSNYTVIDTKVNIKEVSNQLNELLLEKARQPKTLWLRFNCLRSFRSVLNRLPEQWQYSGEVFPCVYYSKILWNNFHG